MSQCPYQETFINPLSLQTESNSLYFVWHEGYEAHKLEIANLVINVAMLTVEFETEIREINEMKRELEKEKNKF